jgi:hypothetical protein
MSTSSNRPDPTRQLDSREDRSYVSLFWWQIAFLVGASIFSAAMAWVLATLHFYEWPIYRSVDFVLSQYFVGIVNLTHASESPVAWRFYFYSMIVATVFGCMSIGKKSWHLSSSESKLNSGRWTIGFLAMGVLFLNGWFILFNARAVALNVLSRGAALIAVFHTSYIGLALTGWFLFFFITICVALLAKFAGSNFRS